MTHPLAALGDDPAEAVTVSRLRASDERACAEFVRSHAGMALAVARRILRNESDAHDALQDAFASFFRSLSSFRGHSRLSTWLHRIVVNAALMKRRSMSRRPECSIEDLLPRFHEDGHRVSPTGAWGQSAEHLSQDSEVRAMVRRKIDELPDDFRAVLVLRDVEELDTEETARILGDTPGAVKTRLHRARQALRTLLEAQLDL